MKAKKRSRDATGPSLPVTVATSNDPSTDHVSRQARRAKTSRASVFLSHDTREKKSALKLKLHRTRLERIIESMKARLQSWDPVAEAQIVAAAKTKEERDRLDAADDEQPKKKRGRLGPETWKLRGAARPASEVYDFDVRYVDPHMKAHDDAREKARRTINLLALAKKKDMGATSFLDHSGEVGREYLAHLMQLAHVSQEMKHYKTSRECFLDCLELDTDGITTAREDLMRMYMSLGRTDAALRLGEKLEKDEAVWIRYSHALLGFQAKQDDAEHLLVRAIQANPFCAYYLAFYATFSTVMEYTDEVENADDVPQSSLEEAIEYCSGDASQQWIDTKAAEELRRLLLVAKRGGHETLTASSIEWSKRLEDIEAAYEANMTVLGDAISGGTDIVDGTSEIETHPSGENVHEEDEAVEGSIESNEDEYDDDDEDSPGIDVRMYAGMFRTAMDMLQESGSLG